MNKSIHKKNPRMTYWVINLSTGQSWEGTSQNAKEAYSHITIKKGDTTICRYGKISSSREW